MPSTMLQVGDIAVLSGNDGRVVARIVGLDCLCNAEGRGVIGAEGDIQNGSVGVVGSQGVLEVLESGIRGPCRGGNLLKAGLAGRDIQDACLDEGLQRIVCAVEEIACIVVCGISGGELDVVAVLGVINVKSQRIDYELALKNAYCIVIEGYIVGDGVGFHDQTVIGDNRNLGILCIGKGLGEGLAVDGGNDKQINAVGDHVGDIVILLFNVVVGILQLNAVAGFLKLLLQVFAVTVPSFKGFRGHCDTDGLVAVVSGGLGFLGKCKGGHYSGKKAG